MTYDESMVGTPPTTADELWDLGPNRRELVRGEVVEVMPPGGVHGRVASRLARFLDEWAEARGGWRCYVETGFRLEQDPDTVRAPDVSLVREERLEGLDERRFLPLAPDLVVEVVSPGESFREVEERVAMWLAVGANRVWVVEAELRVVFVHRPDSPREVLREGDTVEDEPFLPGLAFSVARLS